MRIITYQPGERDDAFYRHIGPLALSRNVTGEMHDQQYGSLYDEPYATWLLAFADDGQFIGCAAIFNKPKEVFLDHCYVLPTLRGIGIGKRLFAARLEVARALADQRPIRGITMNPCQRHIYELHGFTVRSQRGKYSWMECRP